MINDRLSARNTDRIGSGEPLRSGSVDKRSDLRRECSEIDLRSLGNGRERAGLVVDHEDRSSVAFGLLILESDDRLRPEHRSEELVDRPRDLRGFLRRRRSWSRRLRRRKDSAVREVRHREASGGYGRVELALK